MSLLRQLNRGLQRLRAPLVALVVPRWSTLQGLGELRALRASYVILAVIPLIHTFCELWNYLPALQIEHRFEQRNEYLLGLDQLLSSTELERSGSIEQVRNWLDSAHAATGGEELARTAQRATDLMEEHLPPRLSDLIKQWATTARRHAELPVVPNVYLSWRLRLLFSAMVAVTFANLIYSARCPRPLRDVRQRDSNRPILGDRLNWVLDLYDRIKGDDAPAQRQALVTMLIDPRDEALMTMRGTDNPTWAIAAWNRYELMHAPWRAACCLLYWFGLAATAFLLASKGWVILLE